MRYVPNANTNGTVGTGLTFRAWDQTTGTAGSTANTTTNGGATAFSTATATASITVTAVNDAPQITSNGGGATASISLNENETVVTSVASSDIDGGTPVYSIAGGADAGRFAINSSTGALSFSAAPNFESPSDAGANNVFDVIVQVSDGAGGTDTQAIAVTVLDVDEFDVGAIADANGGREPGRGECRERVRRRHHRVGERCRRDEQRDHLYARRQRGGALRDRRRRPAS